MLEGDKRLGARCPHSSQFGTEPPVVTGDQGRSGSGENKPGADYSSHVLAGGGEAQGHGSTDLLKSKL